MNRPTTALGAIFLLAALMGSGTPARAHRLDEYLQATTIALGASHIEVQMRLTPGVAVFSRAFALMDANGDGALSEAEKQGYAERMSGDLSLTVDGARSPLRLLSWEFAAIPEMKAGRGEIELAFTANVPRRNGKRKLVFENHHQSRIAVYLVNCLVPGAPTIQVTGQQRNYLQSHYELDYAQTGVAANLASVSPHAGVPGTKAIPLIAPLLLVGSLAYWRLRQRTEAGKRVKMRQESADDGETMSPEESEGKSG